MSLFSEAEKIIHSLRDPRHVLELFAHQRTKLRQISEGTSIYEIIRHADRRTLAVLRQRLGDQVIQEIRRLATDYPVTQQDAEAYLEYFRGQGLVIGAYEDLRRNLGEWGNLRFLCEADHIIEGRIHRMIRDGIEGHSVRSIFNALADTPLQRALERGRGAINLADGVNITDGLSAVVPANDIVAYELSRLLPRIGERRTATLPWYYVHRGFDSKTMRMSQLIPYRLEGDYTYKQIFDATRWVICHEFGLPRDFQALIRDDLIHSIIDAVDEHDDLRRLLSNSFFGPSDSATTSRIKQALLQQLDISDLNHRYIIDQILPRHPIAGYGIMQEIAEAEK